MIAYGLLTVPDGLAFTDAVVLGALTMGVAGLIVLAWPSVARRVTDRG